MYKRSLRLALIACVALIGHCAAAQADAAQDALVKRGAYVATASDCVACHTAPHEGTPFAGGNPIESPVGVIWSTNITPSKQFGIGNYSYDDFSRAVRQGVAKDGSHLYPAMPYPSYARLTDDDMKALYAYFMQAVPAVDRPAPRTELPFPFNIRASMIGWNLLFSRAVPYVKPEGISDEMARGQYLVDGPAHCSTCHTPRNLLMGEMASKEFEGAPLGKWFAPNITANLHDGIGSWSVDELTAYLKSGVAPRKAATAGPMAEAIDHSFSHLSDQDLHAIAAYILRSASGKPFPQAALTAPHDEARLRGLQNAVEQSGASLYLGSCASCHQPNGRGTSGFNAAPGIAGLSILRRDNPANLINVILYGVDRVGSAPRLMPAFHGEMTNEQVAQVATYVRQTFGDPALAPVTASAVNAQRQTVPETPALLIYARAGMALGAIVALIVLLLIVMWARRGPAAKPA